MGKRGGWLVVVGLGWDGRGEIPLLNLVKAGEERDGDEDDDCFLAVADFELWVGEREASLAFWCC